MSLLRTEGVLPGEEVEEEENIHHNFALVERWREVSKVIRGIICQHLGIPNAEPKPKLIKYTLNTISDFKRGCDCYFCAYSP